MLNMLVSNRIESQVGLGKKKFFFFLVQSVQVRFFGPRFMPVNVAILVIRVCVFAEYGMARAHGGGRNPLRCLRRQVARWGQPVSTMWHLAPEAPPELFWDPALLEEAGAHGMAGGAQI
jgi:hypothetical protein